MFRHLLLTSHKANILHFTYLLGNTV